MIELSRNITFGQYINNGSTLSRMDPRTKLFCAFLLIAVICFLTRFLAFVPCLLLCIALQQASHISAGYALRTLRPFIGLLLFAFAAEVLFYPSPPHAHYYWQWWIFNISREGLIINALGIIRVLFLYYIVTMLMFVTSLVDLTDGSEVLLSPLQKIGIPVSALVMVMVIAFKFVPIFVAEVERLIKAQTARGVRFDEGNFMQRARKLAPLFIPLFVSGFKRAEVLKTAMEARCYGRHKGWVRSKRREMHFERYDALVLAATVTVCIIAVLLSIFAPF